MSDDQALSVESALIGRASATDRDPNTSDQFSFWLAPDLIVNPFDIVEAEQYEDSRTYGLVVGLEHRTDAPSHLSNFISNDFGALAGEPAPAWALSAPQSGRWLAAHQSPDRQPAQADRRTGKGVRVTL